MSAPDGDTPRALIVMGVSGCGKSTVGKACALALGWSFVEGDDYHTAASVAKMHAGIALSDADRDSWLGRLEDVLREARDPASPRHAGLVLPCSALRKKYRDRLREASPGLRFAFLALSTTEALDRVAHRPGHFFAPELVASQFATLESPSEEAGVLTLNATQPVAALVNETVDWLTHAPESQVR